MPSDLTGSFLPIFHGAILKDKDALGNPVSKDLCKFLLHQFRP